MTEIDLTKHATNLVVGKNGAGKSVLMEVISFVLYGKAFRKINKPQLVNINNGNNLRVEIELSIGKHNYTVIRGIKPNLFEIYEDGVLINQDSKNLDYQVYLENDILSMNYVTFTQLIALGKATHVPFMRLSPVKRREMIEHLLGISVFYDINKIVKDKLRAAKFDKDRGDSKLDLLFDKLAMKNEYQSNTKEDKSNLIHGFEITIKLKNKEISQLEHSNQNIVCYIETLEEDLQDDVSGEHKKYNGRKRDIENKVKTTKDEISFFENNTICPTCTQAIDDNFRSAYIDDRVCDLDKLSCGKHEVEEKIIAFKEIEGINDLINEKITTNRTTINQNDLLIRRLKTDIENEEERIDECKAVDDGRDISLEIAQVEEDIKEQQTRNDKFGKLIDYYIVMGDILDDDGVKALIIKKYLPLFNKYINNYLNKLGLPVTFVLDEQFNETILARHRDNFSYSSFSEGEKLRIDLSIMMSWRDLCKIKNSMDSNLLIMDEIFDSSLSQSGVDAFVEILQEMEGINTFVISHTPEKLADRFDNTIEIQKINGFSQIKEKS